MPAGEVAPPAVILLPVNLHIRPLDTRLSHDGSRAQDIWAPIRLAELTERCRVIEVCRQPLPTHVMDLSTLLRRFLLSFLFSLFI